MDMKLSIDKFQRLQAIASLEGEDFEKASRLVQVILEKTADEVDEMNIKEFTYICEKIKQIFDIQIDAATMSKPKSVIKANGKTYHLNFDVKSPFNTGRYIEVLTFSKDDPVANMHNILASICTPMKWSWLRLGYVKDEYDVSKHEEYAEDFKHADFQHGYHAMVFFYSFLRNLTTLSSQSLEEMITSQASKSVKVKQLKSIFPNLSVGSTTPSK